MSDRRIERMLIEEATSAWRPRTPDGTILPHPAWADLAPDARREVHDETVVARRLERGLHGDGFSTTVQAVLSRLR